jgi:hypothetical protein
MCLVYSHFLASSFVIIKDFLHGNSEKVTYSLLCERVQNIFHTRSNGPIFLLVNNEKATRLFLRFCGIDDSRIVSGIKSFLEGTVCGSHGGGADSVMQTAAIPGTAPTPITL